MTEIYLIRHGEAEGNVFRRLHGQYDALLTPPWSPAGSLCSEAF